MNSVNAKARAELELVRQKSGGFLKPSAVVKFAKSEKTELHKYFIWDNDEAAERYRLVQASAIIRVAVQIIPGTENEVRTFVSLREDRKEGRGYRHIEDVIEDEVLTEQLLEEARADMERFERRYQQLSYISEFREVFLGMQKAKTVVNKKKPKEDRVSA